MSRLLTWCEGHLRVLIFNIFFMISHVLHLRLCFTVFYGVYGFLRGFSGFDGYYISLQDRQVFIAFTCFTGLLRFANFPNFYVSNTFYMHSHGFAWFRAA